MRNLQDLGKRFLVSFLLMIFLGGLIFFSSYIVVKWILMLFVMAVALIAMWEYLQIAKNKEMVLSTPLMLVATVLEILSFFMISQTKCCPKLPVIMFFVILFFLFLSNFRKIEGSMLKIALSCFGLIYLVVPLGMVLPILFAPKGIAFFIYLLVVTKITDVGAYFGGRLWGKRKLAATLSPKKTLEGAILGFLCALGSSLLFSFFTQDILSLKEAVFLGILFGIVGQFGDLAESLLKRDAKVKDSNSLPGLGGVLDMVDSLLFTIPVLYFFLKGGMG